MHPLHPGHPYNNGQGTLLGACRNNALSAFAQERAWHEHPAVIVGGLLALAYFFLPR